MGTSAEEVYAAFLEKVKRTIYVDNLSPQVTEPVVRTAFNQFGYVKSVQFISIYLESKNAPQAALVEMENPKQASSIITEMGSYPFMILGMPRPIRASAARLEMFDDRPRKPGRKILCRWLDPKEPEFQVAKKLKCAVRKHAAETLAMLEEQRAEEEKLASQQSETLLAQYKKYDLLQAVFEDGSAKRLGRHYEMPVADA
ncbi:uncharacterized protein LOC131019958 isoform X2 [Salvia miltiorrhiza]|uniref:uncharacterized protein LOC131019958 isoform X2 n=1 Tax=Salvia miltiorrhiza TaxID=226208 RepID=UPI0025ABF00E|nr:uncharacterized protein LOC131019958 isoform X2 [Salvia miltiorrhiza]XP_057804573.1 uncharacterized protein LOC131019958 isoform X2 [Salvia miltiorrhiza]